MGLRDVTVLGVDERLRQPLEVCIDPQRLDPLVDQRVSVPNVMRRPRITSQSANTNSPMPVMAEISDEEPRASARTAESNT